MRSKTTAFALMAICLANSSFGETYSDELITSTDLGLQRLIDGNSVVYIFTNPAAGNVSVTLKHSATLTKCLLAGGGGAGGWTIGGGGGGGELLQLSPNAELSNGETLTLSVGTGGDPETNAKAFAWPRGGNGGESVLTLGATTWTALGGMGGASWYQKLDTKAAAYGSGGGCSNKDTLTSPDGVTFNGFAGGATNGGDCSGGGGGAGGKGGKGGNNTAGSGGKGIDSTITGSSVNYCAGGSGGCGNSCYKQSESGGTSGGKGAANGSGKRGGDAPDGFGGGGGGGSYYPATAGGRGGAGTVILRFQTSTFSILKINKGNTETDVHLTPGPGSYIVMAGENKGMSAGSATNGLAGIRSLISGYTLQVNDGESQTFSDSSYSFAGSESVASVTLTWLWHEQYLRALADGETGRFLMAWCEKDNLPAADTAANFDEDVAFSVYDLTLTNGWTFAESEKPLSIGAGGIRTVDAKTATTYTFKRPVSATAQQEWYVGTNTTVEFEGSIDLRAPVTLRGRGIVNLRQPGTGSAVMTVAGCADPEKDRRGGAAITINAYTNDVFGSGTAALDILHTKLCFIGDWTQTVDFTTSCNNNDWDYNVYFMGNLTFNASWQHFACNTRPTFYRGKTVVFNKLVKTNSSMYNQRSDYFSSKELAEVIFNGTLCCRDRFNVPAGMRFTLNSATNCISGNKGTIEGIIRCGCARALEYHNGFGGCTYFYPGGEGTIDMNGFDQGVGCIYSHSNAGKVISEKPATLHLVDNWKVPDYDSGQKDANGKNVAVPGWTNYCVFAGAASLSKEGKYTNRLVRVSTTTGDLTVTNGRLEFAPSATWLNASNVTAKSTGVFCMEDRTAKEGQPFGKFLDFHLSEEATVELNNSVPLRVRYLFVDGERADFGCYWGSEEAKAANPDKDVRTDSRFTGSGLIFARGIPGLAVIVR